MNAPSTTTPLILFVCTGNTCRSPLAEALARREIRTRGLEGRVRVGSAGVAAYPGQPASEGSRIVALEEGLDLAGHLSTPLTADLAGEARYVLGMSQGHVLRAGELAPHAQVELLSRFALGPDDPDALGVPDPFGGPVEVYQETLQVLRRLVAAAVDRIEEQLGSGEASR